MNKAKRVIQRGFTLIELLIVVVIVAILAAIVIPQFGNTSTEAKESTLDANLAAMRTAIELYKIQHNNVAPGAATSTGTCPAANGTNVGAALNTAEALKAQLTSATNAAGVACPIAGGEFVYGPYLKTKFPADPLKNSEAVEIKTAGAPLAPTAATGGWMYDTVTGQFIVNTDAKDSKGKLYSAR